MTFLLWKSKFIVGLAGMSLHVRKQVREREELWTWTTEQERFLKSKKEEEVAWAWEGLSHDIARMGPEVSTVPGSSAGKGHEAQGTKEVAETLLPICGSCSEVNISGSWPKCP